MDPSAQFRAASAGHLHARLPEPPGLAWVVRDGLARHDVHDQDAGPGGDCIVAAAVPAAGTPALIGHRTLRICRCTPAQALVEDTAGDDANVFAIPVGAVVRVSAGEHSRA